MFSSTNFNTSHHVPIFTLKSSSSSSSPLTSSKIKNLIRTLIISRLCRIIGAISKLKSTLVEILTKKKKSKNIHFLYPSNKKYCRKTKKIIMGSFRLHYNWSSRSSSIVMPVPSRVYEGLPKAVISGNGDCCHDSELAGYLQWLEENDDVDGYNIKVSDEKEEDIFNKDVDMLAEMFIANCHEKFRVEREESNRKYHEMVARTL